MKVGVVIGRFQPFHNGHKHLVDAALAASDKVVVVVGSTGTRPDTRNPLSFQSVERLIRNSYSIDDGYKLEIRSHEDEPYNDSLWVAMLTGLVSRHVGKGDSVTLFGHKKDASSYYQNLFQFWGYQDVPLRTTQAVDATLIRSMMFSYGSDARLTIGKWIPYSYSLLWAQFEPDEWERLCAEHKAIVRHKIDWRSIGTEEYGVQHVACDVLLRCQSQVLLIERGGLIGRGSLALPGGFVNAGERIIDACFRELKEETGIDIAALEPDVYRAYRHLGGVGVTTAFDYPWRSLTGRIFTHALSLRTTECHPPVASDDASKAMWVPVNELSALKPKFYGDHYHMVKHLINNVF